MSLEMIKRAENALWNLRQQCKLHFLSDFENGWYRFDSGHNWITYISYQYN